MGVPSVQKNRSEMAGGRSRVDWSQQRIGDHKSMRISRVSVWFLIFFEQRKRMKHTPFFVAVFVQDFWNAAEDEDTPFFSICSMNRGSRVCRSFCAVQVRQVPGGYMVALVDWMVGQVMDALDRCGVADDTLVIVTSDNGALPGCNGRTYGHKSCGDWRGFKGLSGREDIESRLSHAGRVLLRPIRFAMHWSGCRILWRLWRILWGRRFQRMRVKIVRVFCPH